MENKNPISEELKDISMLVAAAGNQVPYTVPTGYFDNLAVQVMLRIALEEKSGADPVLNISKENPYGVPQQYFENLAGSVLNRIKAENASNPDDELELLSPFLKNLGKKHPFTFPENYFTDFSDNIVAGVKAIDFVNEELENLSPLMLALKDKHVYEVPDGYFTTSVATFLNKAKHQAPARVISFGFRKLTRYAAAAVVTGIIVFSGYFYTANKNHATPLADIPTAMAAIPDQEVENFLNNNTVALADVGMDADTGNAVIANTSNVTDDTKDLLADISDEELQKYIDQHTETPVTN